MAFINRIYNTIRFDIDAPLNGQLNTDKIFPIVQTGSQNQGISFVGAPKIKSINLIGNKLCYTIPSDLSFTTISNGIFLAQVDIPAGIYSQAQLVAIVCATGTGIIVNTSSPLFLIASNTANLLSVRFALQQEAYITNLLGLSGNSTQSGNFITYDLPISGKFPNTFDFLPPESCEIKLGFSTDPNLNPVNLFAVPLTILNNTVLDLGSDAPFNSLSTADFVGNLPTTGPFFWVRILLSNYKTNFPIANVNNLSMNITFEDEIPVRVV